MIIIFDIINLSNKHNTIIILADYVVNMFITTMNYMFVFILIQFI